MLLALLQLSAAFTPLPALTPSANAVRVEPVVCSAISSRRAALLAGGAAVASFLPSASQATQPTAVSGSLPTSASLALDLDDEEDRAVLQLAIIAAIIAMLGVLLLSVVLGLEAQHCHIVCEQSFIEHHRIEE